MQQNLYGALGAGGTKMICGIVDGTGKIIDQKSFPTTTPKAEIFLILLKKDGKTSPFFKALAH